MNNKMYSGHVPSGDGWEQIGDRYHDGDGVEWQTFRRRQDHSPEWQTVKVAAIGTAPAKANYWLARNGMTGQIGYARDYAIMRETRPGLHAHVDTVLRGGK